ncbi:hypothetical protein POF50_011070 [Streptomyces sp. SL13]|uniref:Uncharacterized protein n=1 Tax=Streptantibioticus silvisoli TaxID=2705255 RepID=A0AA90KFY7_9ACTN|nr:hypothetical protein [Streptantibioticus silvisoli]MDI5969870.1 hypothetical protein [Streptantibioticus silvisoli]
METRRWFALLHHDQSYDPKYRIQLLSEERATRCLRYAEGQDDLSSPVRLMSKGTAYATLVPLVLGWDHRGPEEIAQACAGQTGTFWYKPFDTAQYMESATPAFVQEIAGIYASDGHQVAISPGLVAVEYPGQEPFVFFSEDFASRQEES